MIRKYTFLLSVPALLSACMPVEIPASSSELNARFTKLANDGSDLPVQTKAWDRFGSEGNSSQWSCVKDDDTGLIWEVKTNNRSGELTDSQNTYSWYQLGLDRDWIPDPDDSDDDGMKMIGFQDGGDCSGSACDTSAYVNARNTSSVCGADSTDEDKTWRLPTIAELDDLVICVAPEPASGQNPLTNEQAIAACEALDTVYTAKDFFPNTEAAYYWADEQSTSRRVSRAMDFKTGTVVNAIQANGQAVRLVMGPKRTDSE